MVPDCGLGVISSHPLLAMPTGEHRESALIGGKHSNTKIFIALWESSVENSANPEFTTTTTATAREASCSLIV